MKKQKLLLIILGVMIFVKIGLYQLCKMTDKGFTVHSSTLVDSKSNKFLLDNYIITEIRADELYKKNKELNFNSIFVENNWKYKCPIIGIDQIPTKAKGYNIVLPMRVEKLESLAKYSFYLAIEKDTIILRGNQTLETAYYHKSWDTFSELSNSQLLIKNKNGELIHRFKLKKENS